jgi:hypothetical protein
LLVLEPVEAAIRAEEALLDDVLGVAADQAPGEAVQARELALGEDPEPLDGRLGSHHSTIS